MKSTRTALAAPLLLGALLTGCSSAGGDTASPAGPSAPSESGEEQMFPDVVKAELSGTKGSFTLDVTMSSPYDSPDRYADGWRVLDPDGKELGTHMLTHNHASEQPFTRQQSDLTIPDGVQTITVEGRDQISGYGGKTVDVTVPQ